MRILMINKFLYPNGGSETYIFKLGEYLKKQGHEVQYFGMEHSGRIVGNRVEAYTSDMDFHGGSKLAKLSYPLKTIYSSEARKQLRKVLEDFQPDVCHFNNFNYQLTPSTILEIVKWRKEKNKKCKIVYTAHDYQLICPNHMLKNPNTNKICEKCIGKNFKNCIKGKCIHGSMAKSIIGATEAKIWNSVEVYKNIDTIVCCSEFMKKKLDTNPIFAKKTIVIHNFVDKVETKGVEKKNYILYFGRFSEEKGVKTLIEVCKELPEIPFIFAGTGPLEENLKDIKNITDVGFKTGEVLDCLIREAKLVICPSEWYEPFGLTIIESQSKGTPVIGANIGAISELIIDNINGKLFSSGDKESLRRTILDALDDKILEKYRAECRKKKYIDVVAYSNMLLNIYEN